MREHRRIESDATRLAPLTTPPTLDGYVRALQAQRATLTLQSERA